MKYFKSGSGEYFAYEDDAVVPDGMTPMTETEIIEATQVTTPAERLAQMIADRRYTAETSGIIVNGVKIDTGRDSQSLITGAALSAFLDKEYVCTWKTVDGPVRLTATNLIAIATAVRSHVQSCFDRERELLAAIADESYTDTMFTEGWPT